MKMFTVLAIVAAMLIAGAALATNGSGSTAGVTLGVEDVSTISIPSPTTLALDITPLATSSSVDSNTIALTYDSNFLETFTIALTSTGTTPLPGTWTITSATGGNHVVLTSNSVSGDTANASFTANPNVAWASAPTTNIGLTVTGIDLDSPAATAGSGTYAGILTFTTSTKF